MTTPLEQMTIDNNDSSSSSLLFSHTSRLHENASMLTNTNDTHNLDDQNNDNEIILIKNNNQNLASTTTTTSKRRESLNLAPSPTLYNVSLAEAENLDDDYSESANNSVFYSNNENHQATSSNIEHEEIVEFVDNVNETYEILASSSTESCSTTATTTTTSTKSSNSSTSSASIVSVSTKPVVVNSTGAILKMVSNYENCAEKTDTSNNANKLNPEEKVSNDAKEYWATIDFYNNSKMAFNKRCKSVKAKRDKLNDEIRKREEEKHPVVINTLTTTTTTTAHCHSNEACMCVKCSIVYHESVIKNINSRTGEQLKVCCTSTKLGKVVESSASVSPSASSSSSSISATSGSINRLSSTSDLPEKSAQQTNSSSVVQQLNSSTSSGKEEFGQLDEKLFNIKNELVNLSESSLDVFQLLLQLSDTMLDLNNQLTATANASRLLKSTNSLMNTNNNQPTSTIELNIDEEYDNVSQPNLLCSPATSTSKKDSTSSNKNKSIDQFLQKTLNLSQPATPVHAHSKPSSIHNIINQLNQPSHPIVTNLTTTNLTNSIGQSNSNNKKLTNIIQNFNQNAGTIISPAAAAAAVVVSASPNVQKPKAKNYESSVTKFVDSLFNSNSSYATGGSTHSSSTNIYHSIDEEEQQQQQQHQHLHPHSLSTKFKPKIVLNDQNSRFLSRQQHQNSSLKTANQIKSSSSSTSAASSSSSSSSSGCCGSSTMLDTAAECASSSSSSENDRNSIISNASSILLMNEAASTTTVNTRSVVSSTSSSPTNQQHVPHQVQLGSVMMKSPVDIVPMHAMSKMMHPNIQGVCNLAHSYSQQQQQQQQHQMISNNQQRSNSINYKMPTSQVSGVKPTHSANLNYSVSSVGGGGGNSRRPSFKFESNILTRVQTMNNSSSSSAQQPSNGSLMSKLNRMGEIGRASCRERV